MSSTGTKTSRTTVHLGLLLWLRIFLLFQEAASSPLPQQPQSTPSSSSSIPLDGWRFPCSDGRNDSVFLSEENDEQMETFREEARKEYRAHLAYHDLSKMVLQLKTRIKAITNDYFTERFPGEEQETYKDMTIDIIPIQFGKDVLEASSQTDADILEEAYENFARFSIYLHFAVAGEKKEIYREKKYDEDYESIYSDPEYGLGSILCKLHQVMIFFGSEEKPAASLERVKVDSMPRYLDARPSVRHMKDFLVMRQFAENLETIRGHFLLREETHRDKQSDSSRALEIKERNESQVLLENNKMVATGSDLAMISVGERRRNVKDEERGDEEDEEEMVSTMQMGNLEKILKPKREKPKQRKKGRASRKINGREHHNINNSNNNNKEYDVFMHLI